MLGPVPKGPSGRFRPDDEHVKVLIGAAATRYILTALGDIRARAAEDDLVFLYISSHGLPGRDDPTGVSYVVTYDVDRSSPGRLYATALPMVELRDFSRMLKAGRFVLMLDTCFGGGATESKSLVAIKPIEELTIALQGVRTALAAPSLEPASLLRNPMKAKT